MKENDAMRPISNERPEFLVLEKCNESAIACYSDGEMMLLKISSDKVLTDGTTCLKDMHFDFLFMFCIKKYLECKKL